MTDGFQGPPERPTGRSVTLKSIPSVFAPVNFAVGDHAWRMQNLVAGITSRRASWMGPPQTSHMP